MSFGDKQYSKYVYNSDGEKMKAIYFTNQSLEQVLFDGGYMTLDSLDIPHYHFYQHDHLGSVRAVVDENGVTEHFDEYYPFGATYVQESAPNNRRYKYNGKELDRMHGLNLLDYGARWYDPLLGRFTTMDPLCEKYYSISPYAYCANNPVNYVDPDGRKIKIRKSNQKQVLGYINKIAQGNFSVDKKGYLYLSKPSSTKGFSSTYTKSLGRAIKNNKNTIYIFIDDYYLDEKGQRKNISRKGEGATKEYANGDISVVISGESYNNLVDKDGEPISDGPEYILAHEIAGHAEPRLNKAENEIVVNAVEVENAIRRETNEKERKEEPNHVQ